MRTLFINNQDFSSYITQQGETVSYKKIEGKNSGYMLSGDYTEDIIAIKRELKVTLMPLSKEDLSTLLSTIYASDTVEVTFFDPRLNTIATMTAHVSEQSGRLLGYGTNAVEYWNGGTLTFTER